MTIVELWPIEADCFVCSDHIIGPSFGIPVYEGEVLPDNDPGEWGGVAVCEPCFDSTNGCLSRLCRRVTIQEIHTFQEDG